MDITDRVKTCISKALRCEIDAIDLNHSLLDNLGADSLSLILVQHEVEDEFGIDISHLEPADMDLSVAELIKMIEHFIEKSKE
jgi:acyl carrier protein